MNNFGVIEVASTKTTNAPGWAYVPDVRPQPALTAASAAGRKRARNAGPANLSHADLNARQEAKVRRELEALDRDNARDTVIPIPPRSGKSGGGRQAGKHTPNVRKILQSQKTFANHLDDFIALGEGGAAAAEAAGPGAVGGSSRTAAAAATAAMSRAKSGGTAQAQQKKGDAPARNAGRKESVKQEDVEMTDAPATGSSILQPYNGPSTAPHASDNNPLLVSRVPPVPEDDELRALMAAPPLSYLEARAGWTEEDQRYPTRVFCEVCGYWGRVRCMKCGTRVCALDCLETHREECVTRYGF